MSTTCHTRGKRRLAFHFVGIRIWLLHKKSSGLPVERVRGIGVKQQLRKESLKDIQQVCTGQN